MVHLKKLPNNHFAHGFTVYKLFWVFMAASLIGFIHENIWAVIKLGEPHLRKGLIYGPFVPIYGAGAVLFLILLHRIKNSFLIFAAGSFLGACFEFFMSLAQQYLFGTVSWDYSRYPLNIGGRTTLFYAFFWGFLCLLFLKVIYPRLSFFIDKLPERSGRVLTLMMAAFFLADCALSALAVSRMVERSENIRAETRMDAFLDKHYPDDRLRPIFNNLEITERNTGFDLEDSGG